MTYKHRLNRRNRLKREIAQLRKLAFAPPEHSKIPDSDYLEIERDSVIRARVLLDCALLEEAAAIIIMDHVLTDCPKWNEIKYFGRIKRYYIFYDDILGTLERMLALRDVFAHVRTLDYNKKRDLDYKGQSILSKAGFKSYLQDSTDVIAFLIKKTNIF